MKWIESLVFVEKRGPGVWNLESACKAFLEKSKGLSFLGHIKERSLYTYHIDNETSKVVKRLKVKKE